MTEKNKNNLEKINLREIEKTLVHTKTQEEYNSLMKIYEIGGWTYNNPDNPSEKESPLKTNFWRDNNTCVTAYSIRGIINECPKIMITNKKYELNKSNPRMIISLERFCKRQNISSEERKKIEQHFKDFSYENNFWKEINKIS